MARSIWKGNINFGLVSVPVELFPTVQRQTIRFHRLSKDGKCRLRQKLYCPETGKEYDFTDTAKGYEIAPDQYVILEEKELNTLKPESGRSIQIVDFVPLEDIDPLFFEKGYFLAPEERSLRAYKLLQQSMLKSKKVGIAKFVMREKQYLAVVRPLENALCLETMHYADELLSTSQIPGFDLLNKNKNASPIESKELKMADQLIEAMTVPFSPKDYKDEFRKSVDDLLHQKAKGKKIIKEKSKSNRTSNVIDIMDALRKSLASKKTKPTNKSRATKKKASKS